MFRLLLGLTTCCVLFLSFPRLVPACESGPDAASGAALQAAIESQRVIRDQLTFVAIDRDSRRFYAAVTEERYQPRALHGQASLFVDSQSVARFRLCDTRALVPARLERQQLGFGVGIGYRDIVRFDARLFGVSDSVVQRDLDPYAPPPIEGAVVTVPGAGGLGQGMWALRLELFELVAASVGRVRNQQISHEIGWEMQFDDEGNETGLERFESRHWRPMQGADAARWFATLGAPEWVTTELVIGGGRLEGLGIASGRYGLWQTGADIEGAARWDGIIAQPVVELGLGVYPVIALPDLRLAINAATELATPRVRELSARARFAKLLAEVVDLGVPADLELFSLGARVGVTGGERIADGLETALVPGVDVEGSVAIPIYAIIRIGAFAGMNRPETLSTIPAAAGHFEWGASLYITYAF